MKNKNKKIIKLYSSAVPFFAVYIAALIISACVAFGIVGLVNGKSQDTSVPVVAAGENSEAADLPTREEGGEDLLLNENGYVTEKLTSLGEFRLTAYCPCQKCCGKWAIDRPTDDDGNVIVYTASMSVAQEGVTVAADTTLLPFGSIVVINGHEYEVQDRGGAIKGNRIDIYFEDHDDACDFGVQYAEVFLLGKEATD